MKRTALVIAFLLIAGTAGARTENKPIIKVGDRYLVQVSKADGVHEVRVIESANKGKYIRVRHDYNIYTPQVIWERIDDFQKTIIKKLKAD